MEFPRDSTSRYIRNGRPSLSAVSRSRRPKRGRPFRGPGFARRPLRGSTKAKSLEFSGAARAKFDGERGARSSACLQAPRSAERYGLKQPIARKTPRQICTQLLGFNLCRSVSRVFGRESAAYRQWADRPEASYMAKFTSLLVSTLDVLKRGAIGFVAGIIVAWLALTFLGLLHGHSDLSITELDQEHRGRRIVLYIACGAAVFAMIVGRIHVSKYWLWFTIAFGVICVIPFWPHKNGLLLPFATPYVNFGFETADAIILALHVSIALAVAAKIHWEWPVFRRRKKAMQQIGEREGSAQLVLKSKSSPRLPLP